MRPLSIGGQRSGHWGTTCFLPNFLAHLCLHCSQYWPNSNNTWAFWFTLNSYSSRKNDEDPLKFREILFPEPTETYFIRKNIDIANEVMRRPSDIAFILTKNTYIQTGLLMKRLSIPYRLRLSKEPVTSASGKAYSWNTIRYAILAEPFAKELLRIRVCI